MRVIGFAQQKAQQIALGRSLFATEPPAGVTKAASSPGQPDGAQGAAEQRFLAPPSGMELLMLWGISPWGVPKSSSDDSIPALPHEPRVGLDIKHHRFTGTAEAQLTAAPSPVGVLT